jgi:hypothetical protein
MRRAVVFAFVILAFVRAAEALTVKDVIELSRAGLGEDVLLALIDVDGGVYAIDNATLKSLKQAGVSERVIVALVRSGRERPEPQPVWPVESDPAPAPAPQIIVIDHHEPPQIREVLVPMPVYIPVETSRSRFFHRSQVIQRPTVESTYVPFQSGLPATRPVAEPQPPVYWGFGGKLRPDAWGQKPDRDRGKPKDKQ